MQIINLIDARLGRDAAVRQTKSGQRFLSFPVAVDGRWKGENITSWYDILTYDVDKYEKMLPYLTKGTSVVITGELYAEVELGTDNVTRCRRSVNADTIRFLPKGKKEDSEATATGTVPTIAMTSSPKKAKTNVSEANTPDDIPMGVTPSTNAPVVQIPSTATAATSTYGGESFEPTNDEDLPF